MGGSESRSIKIEAGDDGVVTISEAVARRLKGLPDKEDKAGQGSSQTLPPQHAVPSFTPMPPDEVSVTPIPLKANPEAEDFYIQKLKELQERNANLQQQTNDQFAKAVKEVEQKFLTYTASPVCQDLQSKVLECYQENSSQILNCSSVVNAFTSCVDRARMAASSSRMQTVS